MKSSRTIANKVYKYVHNQDVTIKTNLTGRAEETDFFRLDKDGMMTVLGSHENGYAWDGCSPKWHFLHLVMGTPDGKLDYSTEKPITYYASMLHDAIYQYKDKLPISRAEADKIFLIILKDAGFMWSSLYYRAVVLFGGLYGSWLKSKSTVKIKIQETSWGITSTHPK